MCIATIIDEIMAIDWKIIPKDDEIKDDEIQDHINDVTEFFQNPNIDKESFGAQLKKVIRDVLTIDSGVWVKVFNKNGELREIYVRDGGTFTLNVDIFGTFRGKADKITADFAQAFNNPTFWTATGQPRQPTLETLNQVAEMAAYFQYGWITGARPMPFGMDEIIYIMRNPRPDSIYGRSPVEICLDTVQMLVYGIDHNLDYFTDNNVPKGVVQLIGANEEDIKQFAKKWKEATRVKNEVGDYRKRFHHMPVINQEAKFQRISFTNAELELISQSQWFSKVLWACFGVTPSELGFTESSNRATEIVQSRVFRRKAIRPILKLIEYHINTEIIPEFKSGVYLHADTPDERLVKDIDDVKFGFNMYDLNEDIEKHTLYQLQLRNKIKTPNEIRGELGLEPIEGGDELRAPSPFGGFGGIGKFNQGAGQEGEKETEEEKKSIETKPFGPYKDFDDCVSKNRGKRNPQAYCASVHKKIIGQWPSQKAFNLTVPLILGEFEEPDISKFIKNLLKNQKKQIFTKLKGQSGKRTVSEIKDLDKTLIKDIKDTVNLDESEEVVRKAVNNAYNESMDGVMASFHRNAFPNRETVNFITEHALENVRDLGEEIKSKLRKEMETGLMSGESIVKLKKRIGKVFKMADSRAEMIARTEIIRAENVGSLEGYMQTGLKGDIEWVAKMDHKTCQYCRSLNGKTVKLGDSFHDAKWEGKAAPRHPSCRCRIVFKPA